jgi:hypothetical protein
MSDIKTNKMLVNVVLDRSGSMGGIRSGTISGYNEYINGLRADKDSEYSVTLIQFDTNGPQASAELTISYVDKPLAEVPELTEAGYEPRGGTPLYDAIGECVRRVEAKERAVTVVVITDGAENSSKEFTRDSIKKIRSEKEAAGWTFVFIGADIDAYSVGGSVGMSAGNTMSYRKGDEQNLYQTMSASTMMRAASNRTVGMRATAATEFFTPDQKSALGDQGTGVTTTTGGYSPATAGGQPPAATANFPKPHRTPPVAGKPTRPKRDWTVSDAGIPVA